MHPQLFGVVKSYGLLLAISFVLGIWLSVRRGRARGFNPDAIMDVCFAVLVSSLIGVRLFFVLTHLDEFHPWYLALEIWKGGLTLYGGIILATATVLWYGRRRGMAFLPLADVLAPQVALGIGITRIGCFLNGCCFGRPTDSWLGVVFPLTCEAGRETGGAALYPTQLFASLGGFLIWGLLLLWERRRTPKGATFGRFLILYGISRSVVDLFRDYEPGAIGPLGVTVSQWISIALIVGGIVLLATRRGEDARAAG